MSCSNCGYTKCNNTCTICQQGPSGATGPYGLPGDRYLSTFTAIITDPPYAMSESIYQGDDNMITRDIINNDQDANIYTNKVIQNLLTLASKYLDTEGRLVFFLPFRQKIWNNVNGINLLPTLPQNLQFLFSLRQVLSPTFARYLIVIKKNYN